jgi:hypothetical protein
MTNRKKWAVIPGFLVIAAAAAGLSAYAGASSSQGKLVEQPVKFVHGPHVQKLGMNCLYCHSQANKASDPGNAAVATCMGCHTVVATAKPEIKKLTAIYNKKQPVQWNRVHKVPDYVNFPHMRHVNAGVTCQSCHGQIQAQGADGAEAASYKPVEQYASLNMGWCINCHVNGYKPAEGAKLAGLTVTPEMEKAEPRKARYDCAVCHY